MEPGLAAAQEEAMGIFFARHGYNLSRRVFRAARGYRTRAMCAVLDEGGKSMKDSIRKLAAIFSVVTAFAVVTPFAASDTYGMGVRDGGQVLYLAICQLF